MSVPLAPHPLPQALSQLRDARVVVTGATGFIGRHLCPELRAYGAEAFAFQREPGRDRPQTTHALCVDLADRQAVSRTLREVNPDIVLHLAGFVSGDRSLRAMARAFDGNVSPAANLLLCCAEQQPDARVILTTSLDASNPWLERSVTGSPYGVSKLMVEVLAGGMHRLHGCKISMARVGMAYGPNDPNRRRLVPAVILALLRGESPQIGTGLRRCDFIHVDDVVNGLLAMAVAPTTEAALDLGRGELTCVRDVAESIRNILDVATPLIYDARLDRPNEQERAADVELLQRVTGFRAQTDL